MRRGDEGEVEQGNKILMYLAGKLADEWKPKLVKALQGQPICDISAGQRHCVAVVVPIGR